MAPNRGQGPRKGAKDNSTQSRMLKRKRDLEDVEKLSQQVTDLDPKPATPLVDFSQLPLSQATQDGLKSSHFNKLTNIQAQAVPVALKGADVLGAAKTGSGKTLAFIIPVLENLYRKRWTEYDGLGALILSPTRELAIQIFDVLRKVGRNHSFSAGLVIGGKSLQEERDRLGRMNILVATPGRILQHMDQTADLDIGNLQMLIMDEADRIMDMGFQHSVDAIVSHLPKDRQTLLFSATQTKKVSDLARLSLNEPEFVSVHESAESATPSSLQQNYVVTPLPEKLDTLWSFIRANVKKKILVFFSSGKQVRFAYEAFRHLQPGLSLLHLHGRQKQTARLDITTKFSNSKYACLFSTDVAARGLDFPAVDWVVQIDCPEDADTYIHRVGRTARYENDGRAVLFLDPSEKEGMLAALETRRVTGVEEIRVKQGKLQNSIKTQLQNMCFKDPELKYLGQKAFASYVRSVFVQKDKSIFDAKKLDLEEFAASMGLPGAPKVKFIKGEDAKTRKNMPRALAALQDREDSADTDEEGNKSVKEKEKPAVRTKYDRMFERRNQDVLAEHYAKMIDDEEDEQKQTNPDTADADSDDDFMAVKRRFTAGDAALGAISDDESESDSDVDTTSINLAPTTKSTSKIDPTTAALTTKKSINLSTNPDAQPLIVDSNRRSKLLKSKKALLKYKGQGSHVVFSSDNEDDNEGKEKVHYEDEVEFKKQGAPAEQKEKFLAQEKEKVKEADEVDREVAKMKRREKRIKRKERERELDGDEEDSDGDDVGVQLVPFDEDESPAGRLSDNDDDNDDAPADNNKSNKKEKRKRKWFEDPDSDDDDNDDDGIRGKNDTRKKKNKSSRYNDITKDDHQPETLEDLEALAAGLIAR